MAALIRSAQRLEIDVSRCRSIGPDQPEPSGALPDKLMHPQDVSPDVWTSTKVCRSSLGEFLYNAINNHADGMRIAHLPQASVAQAKASEPERKAFGLTFLRAENPMHREPDGAENNTRLSAVDGATRVSSERISRTRDATTFVPGEILGHTYRIVGLVARGGMGEVYRARHVSLGSEHAIKILQPGHDTNETLINLFHSEGGKLRRVRHSAVVTYDGVFLDGSGRHYLAMEFVDGPSLSELIGKGPLDVRTVRILRDRIARGLQAAHDEGIVHRDLSPDNVVLPGGRPEAAKIIDFGIAKDVAPGAGTVLGDSFAGKYSFVSPEQIGLYDGVVDARSDIYSMGLVLAAAALGEPLPMGQSYATVTEARRSLPDLSRLPAGLRHEIAWMLQPDPADRPKSMADLLAGCAGDRREPAAAAPARASRRGSHVLAATVLSVAVLGAGLAIGGWYAWNSGINVTGTEQAASPEVRRQGDRTAVGSSADQVTSVPDSAPLPVVTGPSVQEVDHTAVAAPRDMMAVAEEIRLAATAAAADVGCSHVAVTSLGAKQFAVDGFVASESAALALQSRLEDLNLVEKPLTRLAVHPSPFCDNLASLHQYTQVDSPGSPVLSPDRPDGIYREGESLILKTGSMAQQPGYLYVDYIDIEGTVLHLFPTPARPDNRVKPGSTIVLGVAADAARAGDRYYVVGPPFGKNMMISAIWSAAPLFSKARSEQENAASYLPDLRRSLNTANAGGDGPPIYSRSTFLTAVAK
jgi:hypothetical protein